MAKKREKAIKEATVEDEKLLKSVTKNGADVVTVRGKKFKVSWTHPATCDWITSLILKDGNDSKILCQSAALIVLGGFWRSHLFYWLVWRWFYYVRQYSSPELLPLIEMAQKKTAEEMSVSYLNATILLIGLKDTVKQMTKAEAERFLHELRTAKDGN